MVKTNQLHHTDEFSEPWHINKASEGLLRFLSYPLKSVGVRKKTKNMAYLVVVEMLDFCDRARIKTKLLKRGYKKLNNGYLYVRILKTSNFDLFEEEIDYLATYGFSGVLALSLDDYKSMECPYKSMTKRKRRRKHGKK
jgi:hypothetical protein